MNKHIPVLMYHNIVEKTISGAPDWVSINLFREQMHYILKKGFTPILPRVLLTPEKIPKKPILITFDDGYEGVYTYAFPVLKELKINATIFLITSCLGDQLHKYKNEWSNGDRPLAYHLSIEIVKEMLASNLITIGCHSHSHKYFKEISPADIENEITTSQQLIKDKLNVVNTIFSYPGGYVGENQSTYKILKKNNIQLAFGAQTDKIENINTIDYLNIHRINVMNDTDFTNKKSKLRFEVMVNPYLNRFSRFNKLNFIVKCFLPFVR
jgi:peptidoglycan/xylan/chitin deacetylase (PgdA/CDA1 family)